MSIGQGFGSLEKFCLVMTMDGMSHVTYNKHSRTLCKSTIAAGQNNLEKARARAH